MGRHTEAGLLVDRLMKDLAAANQTIGHLNARIATLISERDEARGKSNHHQNLWGCADREVQRLRAKYGETALPAPAVVPQAAAIEPPPAKAADPDATQLMSSAEIRKATGNDDTAEQAAIDPSKAADVAFEIPARTTWGTKTGDTQALEEWATAPGALPGAGPADIPNSAGLQAVTRVLATTSTD